MPATLKSPPDRAEDRAQSGDRDTNMTNDGILAIWHDVDAAIGDEYERWYFREHLPERVAVPGFLAGRRYEAVSGRRPEISSPVLRGGEAR